MGPGQQIYYTFFPCLLQLFWREKVCSAGGKAGENGGIIADMEGWKREFRPLLSDNREGNNANDPYGRVRVKNTAGEQAAQGVGGQ